MINAEYVQGVHVIAVRNFFESKCRILCGDIFSPTIDLKHNRTANRMKSMKNDIRAGQSLPHLYIIPVCTFITVSAHRLMLVISLNHL